MKRPAINQNTYLAAFMYGINAITYIAVFYILVNSANDVEFVQSVINIWGSPDGKEIIQMILLVIFINSVMCILALISKRWLGLKFNVFIAVAWLLAVVVGYGAVDILLMFTYLVAAVSLSIRMFNKESGKNYA